MLPTRPPELRGSSAKAEADAAQGETEAYAYGYDSFRLLQQLAEHKFQTPMRPLEGTKTGHTFTFDKDGELMPAEKNQYHALSVAHPGAARTL